MLRAMTENSFTHVHSMESRREIINDTLFRKFIHIPILIDHITLRNVSFVPQTFSPLFRGMNHLFQLFLDYRLMNFAASSSYSFS